jgi:hypothetical protein
MNGFVTFVVAVSIGLFVGFLFFGSGNRFTTEDVNRSVETVQEKAKSLIPTGQTAIKTPQDATLPQQQSPPPRVPEKDAEAVHSESNEKKDSSPITAHKVSLERQDWNGKDIDIIFKILNGAQDRLVGKSTASTQEDVQEQSETGETTTEKSPKARFKKKQTSQAPKGIKGKITHFARQLGIKESLALAMCHVESGFNQKAVSNKGAMGLMQVMPGTASLYGVHKRDLFDPDINIRTGLAYFKDMHRFFRNEEMALAAYNCGPARVMEKRIPRETRTYVRDVKSRERYYARKYA